MKPRKQKQVEGAISLKVPEDQEMVGQLEELCIQFKSKYEEHSKLTKQLEEIVDFFQRGEKNKALEIMRAHDSLPELFLVCLEYVCRDPSFDTMINAQIRHAPTNSAAQEMKILYLERLHDG